MAFKKTLLGLLLFGAAVAYGNTNALSQAEQYRTAGKDRQTTGEIQEKYIDFLKKVTSSNLPAILQKQINAEEETAIQLERSSFNFQQAFISYSLAEERYNEAGKMDEAQAVYDNALLCIKKANTNYRNSILKFKESSSKYLVNEKFRDAIRTQEKAATMQEEIAKQQDPSQK